jgi:penicillin-binding protein-related factor A (putative recombinase)
VRAQPTQDSALSEQQLKHLFHYVQAGEPSRLIAVFRLQNDAYVIVLDHAIALAVAPMTPMENDPMA